MKGWVAIKCIYVQLDGRWSNGTTPNGLNFYTIWPWFYMIWRNLMHESKYTGFRSWRGEKRKSQKLEYDYLCALLSHENHVNETTLVLQGSMPQVRDKDLCTRSSHKYWSTGSRFHQRSKPEQMGETRKPNYWAIPMFSSIDGRSINSLCACTPTYLFLRWGSLSILLLQPFGWVDLPLRWSLAWRTLRAVASRFHLVSYRGNPGRKCTKNIPFKYNNHDFE